MADNRKTSEDVARLAGVSQSTVSRVFSNNSRISEVTRQKVLQVAEEIGYRPNNLARGLITNKTNLIGVVVSGIDTAFAPYMLEKLTNRLQSLGYKVLLFNVSNALTADKLLPTALDYHVDGLITLSAIVSNEMVEVCAKFDTPLILFSRRIESVMVNTVNADDYQGGQLAANAMIKAGVKYPAFISGSENTSTSQDRKRGFYDTLLEMGYAPPISMNGDLSYKTAFEATIEMMNKRQKPDGIFVASDLMATGVMDALRYELNYRVPDDIQVIGFDDIPLASRLPYQLTTIRIDVDLMIDETIRILSANITNKTNSFEQITVPVKYVERYSLVTASNVL